MSPRQKEQLRNGKGPDGPPKSRKSFRKTRESDPADWETIDAQLLARAIGAVTAKGGALRFGYTSDGGAYALGIYGDGEPYTEYIRPSEDVSQVLRELIEYVG